jgi:hypothetical protein
LIPSENLRIAYSDGSPIIFNSFNYLISAYLYGGIIIEDKFLSIPDAVT